MIEQITCKQTVKGQFTEGKTYKVDTEYDTHIIVNDDSGSFHHLKKDGEFLADNFSL
ncbi:hypothetical protein D3C74_188930 [compost metagenome]